MLLRTLEPELMDDAGQAEAYALADFAEVNQGFVDRFTKTFPSLRDGRAIDLGCGPADIPIRLARACPGIHIVAIDGSAAMLRHARRAVDAGRLGDRIELVCGLLPGALDGLDGFDAVLSNSLLHHLPNPEILWHEVRRLGRSGAPVLVMDLARPESEARARELVELYAKDERPVLRSDFYNSLLAAFTPDEVLEQLEEEGFDDVLKVEMISDRHWAVAGRLP